MSNKDIKLTYTLSTVTLFTSHVTAALDCNKITDLEALCIIVSVAAALGHDPCMLFLSQSTTHRSRIKARKTYVQSVMTEFQA